MAGRISIGLDIGTSAVRAAQLSYSRDSVTLDRFGQVALPEGAVRGGEVVDVTTVAAAIEELWKQFNFSSKKVILGVSNQSVVVRQVDLPVIPAKELRGALPFHVGDLVPFPVENAMLDFFSIEQITDADAVPAQRGLLVAATRTMIDNAVAAAVQAGLRPTSVDLSSFAVLRALGTTDQLGLGVAVEALVDVGSAVTNIVVHRGGVVTFVRILLLGGHDITEAIGNRLGINLTEAEALKVRLGSLSASADAPVEDQQAARVIDHAVGSFVDEVRGSLDYFLASTGSAPIGRLALSGGGGRLLGLADRVADACRVPVVAPATFASLVMGSTGLNTDQASFAEPIAAVPVGLAMGAFR